MSCSRRKPPIFGIAQARSEKKDKAIWYRRMRAAECQSLQQRMLHKFITK
ncbi:hypothetical protein [Achromobacter pulmonis]|nr:hypothetical protein [Achromobacter pulmonis]